MVPASPEQQTAFKIAAETQLRAGALKVTSAMVSSIVKKPVPKKKGIAKKDDDEETNDMVLNWFQG